jgi:hypothetical protein
VFSNLVQIKGTEEKQRGYDLGTKQGPCIWQHPGKVQDQQYAVEDLRILIFKIKNREKVEEHEH